MQYFLPYRPNVKVVYVNKSRFEEAGATPPETVDEFVSTAQALKEAPDNPRWSSSSRARAARRP